MSSLTDHLKDLLAATSDELPGATWRRMFGCDAVFAGGQIFGLIWKEGRLALRLPDPEEFQALRKEGAVPWTIGAKTMSPWLFVPEEWHDDPEPLAGWIRKAHALALQAPPKVKAAPKTRAAPKAKAAAGAKAAPGPKPAAGAKARSGKGPAGKPQVLAKPAGTKPAPARTGVRRKSS